MKISLRTKLITSSIAVIMICGLAVTLVGIHLIGTDIISQAQEKVRTDLNSARHLYQDEIEKIKDTVRFTALRFFITDALLKNDIEMLKKELEKIRQKESLDILTLTDRNGQVIVRSRNPDTYGDSQADDLLVNRVLSKKEAVISTLIVSKEELEKEGGDLAEQAYMEFIPTPMAKPRPETKETSGMMIKAAVPVLSSDGSLIGVLYGGHLLNRDYEIVDKVKAIVYQDVKYRGKDIGTATIFQGDLRVSTNVKREDASRAIGTRVSKEVYDQVFEKKLPWIDRAFVVNHWYITSYEPIKNIKEEVIGILSVGILEEKFVDMRKEAILDFWGITLAGMLAAFIVSWFLARGILKPIKRLVFASQELAKGNLEYQIKIKSNDEIGELGKTFNRMVSSLKERDEQLKENTQQQIMKSERLASLGTLAAGVAHEINNPLGTISMYSQMTFDELAEDNESCRENLAIVIKQTDKAARIVKNLLEFARQSEPEMRMLDINEVLKQSIAITAHAAELRNIKMAINLNSEIPGIEGDSDKLQQVFINMIINAIHAMPDGGELTIAARPVKDGNFVEIEISDTGCGIPEENIKKLFDPFFSTKETGEGTGLGLSVSLGIVERHGGSIDVRSKVNEGSAFTIKLPVKKIG